LAPTDIVTAVSRYFQQVRAPKNGCRPIEKLCGVGCKH